MTERDIFTAAIEIDEPAARRKFLEQACGTDAALRRGVEDLLQSHADAGSFLEQSPLSPAATVAGGGDTADGPRGDRLATTIVAASTGEAEALTFLAPSNRPGLLGTLDHYEVQSVCGRGGMGIVLKAHDPRLKRIVALKVLAPEFAANPTARKRFLREAQAAAAVAHPHVVTIYAVEEGRPSSTDHRPSSLPYLVMEYIAGQTLRDKVEREGTLSVEAILRIGSQIACGLSAAHKQGLIHRDIKPANVLLENGVERVKLTDFGLARAVDDVSISRTGEVAGTPQYMSPEQAQGHAVDHRSDLFSLGSVLYTMCTGRPPFRGETVVSVIRRVCDEAPRPIHEINAEIPNWLSDMINRLLDKDPARRFQTAIEVSEQLSERLAQWRSGQQVTASLPSPAVATAGLYRRWLTAAAVAVVLLIVIGTSEATGVTNFAGTVIRILRGDGTLVVTIDDPEVSVSIEGEDLVIMGAGAKEIRVPAGEHRLTFHKDGRPIDQQLVSVTRGGREIVTASLESAARAQPGDQYSSTSPQQSLDRVDIDALVSELHRRFPEAQLGLMLANRRLTITGRPASRLQSAAILEALTEALERSGANYATQGQNRPQGEPKTQLLLVNELRPPPLRQILAKLGTPLAQGAQPAWSPDGRRLVYSMQDGSALAVMDMETRRSGPLVVEGPFADCQLVDPAWSPDGSLIAFTRRPKQGGINDEQVWQVRFVGGEATKVAAGGYPSWPAHKDELFVVTRSPQGQALFSTQQAGPEKVRGSLWAVPSLYATVSPDGKLVSTDVQGTLQIRAAESGEVQQSWRLPVEANGMITNWSPDSRYVSVAPYGRDYLGLWIYDTQTGQGAEVLRDRIKGAVWSPDGTRFVLETAGEQDELWVLDLPPEKPPVEAILVALEGQTSAPDSTTDAIDVAEFERDAQTVVKAVRGQITPQERLAMFATQHPVFGQLADPHTKPILDLFASLSEAEHRQGREQGYLKWRFADLPPERQQVYRAALQVNIESAQVDLTPVKEILSLKALEQGEVGFANVDIPEKRARVCSWYILLPEYPSPIWVTVVNTKYAGRPEYFAAHNDQLNRLRTKPLTERQVAAPQSQTQAPESRTEPAVATPVEQDAPAPSGAERLVELAEQDLEAVQKLHARGVASDGELRKGRVELLQARITLACERKRREEVARLFDELIAEREADHADQQRLHSAGVATETDVRNAERRVLQERERKQAALGALE